MNETPSLNNKSQQNWISFDKISEGPLFDQIPWEMLRDVILPALSFSSLLNLNAASPSLKIVNLVKEREQPLTAFFINSLRRRITNDLSEEDQNALLALEDDESILSSTTLEEVQTSILNIKNKLLSILPSLSLECLTSLEKDQSVDAPLNSYRPRYCKNIFDLAIMQRKIDEATQNNASPQELEALYEEILRKAAPEDRNDIDSEWMLEAIKIALKLPAALIYLKQIIRTYVERGHGPVVDIESLYYKDPVLEALIKIYLNKNLFSQAHEITNKMQYSYNKEPVYFLFIRKYLEIGKESQAKAMINQLPYAFDKDKACLLLIHKYLERGEFNKVHEILDLIPYAFSKDKARLLFIQKRLERSEFKQAQEMMNRISDDETKDNARLLYIQKHLERNEFKQAKAMMNQIKNIPYNDNACLLLIQKYLERDEFEQAETMMNQIFDYVIKDQARLLFIQKHLDRDECGQAEEIMRNQIKIDSIKDKTFVLIEQIQKNVFTAYYSRRKINRPLLLGTYLNKNILSLF